MKDTLIGPVSRDIRRQALKVQTHKGRPGIEQSSFLGAGALLFKWNKRLPLKKVYGKLLLLISS